MKLQEFVLKDSSFIHEQDHYPQTLGCAMWSHGDGVSRLRKGKFRPTLILHDGGTGGTRMKGIPA